MPNTFEVHNILRMTMVCEGSARIKGCILGDFAVTRSICRRGYICIYMSAEMKYINDMNNGMDEWMEME